MTKRRRKRPRKNRPSKKLARSCRKKIYNRDNSSCLLCRLAQQVREREITSQPLVQMKNWHGNSERSTHHIRFWANGGRRENYHRRDNLIFLCRECHNKIHILYDRLHGRVVIPLSLEKKFLIRSLLETLDTFMLEAARLNEEWVVRRSVRRK